MPLGLAQQGSRLYLVCRYDGYENKRSLALHRIITAEAKNQTFKRPPEFDLKKYDDDGRFGFGRGKRIKLSFRIKKSVCLHLLESPLSTDQTVIERDDGYYEITATVVDSLLLDKFLLGFGDDIANVERHQID
jgi:predicted DNA-binding transcriptional regulator YafY